jgi:hypothetical protein
VTSIDGASDPIVWAYGHGTNQRLFGYNGETGAVIFAGGGANDTISGTRTFNTGIAARGRIYIAGDNKVYAFKVPFPAFQLSSAVSRKTHGGAGDFDISLPGVECRSGGATNDYTLLFTFSNNLESGNASVTSGTGNVVGTPVILGNTMTVNLTGVADAQTLSVTLSGLTDQFLQTLPDTSIGMSVLIGDVTGNAVVNASDVSQVKTQTGMPVTASNFRADLNANGTITASDVGQVKANAGHGLP